MKATLTDGVWTVRYCGISASHPDWENEEEAINDGLSMMVGFPVKVSREADGDWRATVHKLSITMPHCQLVTVVDNVVMLADALHKAVDAQHKFSTGGVAAPKRSGLIWSQANRPRLRKRT